MLKNLVNCCNVKVKIIGPSNTPNNANADPGPYNLRIMIGKGNIGTLTGESFDKCMEFSYYDNEQVGRQPW